MWNINNENDLRNSYEVLKIMMDRENKNDALEDMIITIKRAIRLYVNAPVSEEHIVKDYGIDGFDVIVPLHISPDMTKEEAEDYFEEYLYINCSESAYDCTGRAFTSWFKVFKRQGKWHAFHAIRYDV